jgi:iron complex outermembrane receptor protein
VDFGNVCKVPGYAVLDTRYAYQLRNVELSLAVNNLLDAKYYTQAFTCAAGVTNGIYPEAGRAFTAALRLKF